MADHPFGVSHKVIIINGVGKVGKPRIAETFDLETILEAVDQRSRQVVCGLFATPDSLKRLFGEHSAREDVLVCG